MKTLLAIIPVVLFCCSAFGQIAGSNFFTHTQSGRSYGKGHFEIYNHTSFYTASVGTVTTPPPPPEFSGSSYWLVQNDLALIYGPVDHFDLIMRLGYFQDAHYMSDFNFPDAVNLTFKGGSLTFADRHIYAAGMLNVTVPLGDVHNYPLVEYISSANFEYGLKAALSYYSDVYVPDQSFSAHLNLGYFSHNAAKSTAYSQDTLQLLSGTNGVEFQYGLAFIYPLDLVEFRLEVSGVQFLQQPDTVVYGRENYTWLTPSIRYKPLRWLSVDLGADVRISSDTDETSNVVYLYSENMGLPNYADWRVHVGLNFTIFPLPPAPRSAEELKTEQFNQRIDYFRGMVEERDKVQNAREDIEAIKKERGQIEREIKALKQALEESGL
jgi:hypothetical protein